MPEFSYTVRPNPRIKSFRKLMDLDARDMREITHRLDAEFRRQRKKTFTTEGAAAGDRWPSLSRKYKKRKARLFGRKKIMQASGALRRSLVNANDPRHVKRWVLRPVPKVTLGTRDPKAAWHGDTSRHNPRLPVRDVVASSRKQMRDLFRVVAVHFKFKVDRVIRVMAVAGRLRGLR